MEDLRKIRIGTDPNCTRNLHRGRLVSQERNVTRRWSNRTRIEHADRAPCEGVSLRPSSSCRTKLLAVFASQGNLSQRNKFITRADHRGKDVTQGQTATRRWSDRTRI